MSLEQQTVVNGHLVAEFFWAGNYIVYIDNVLFDGPYEDAIAKSILL